MMDGSRRRNAFVLALSTLATLLPASAGAQSFEARTYMDMGASWPLAPAHAPGLRLGPFAREENRFRDAGLAYVKTFAGVRMNFSPWLRGAAYYAHKDFPKSDREPAHMAVVDLFLDFHLGSVVGFDKSGFEAHVTDGFFRYRNALELRRASSLGWASPFARGELRVDSDAARINMLDLWGGLLLRLPGRGASPWSMRVFSGYETSRRGVPRWAGIRLLGLELSAHL